MVTSWSKRWTTHSIFSLKHVLLGIWSYIEMLAVASVYGFTWQIVGYVSWRRKSKGLAVLSLNFCPLLVVPLWSLMPPTRGYLSNRSVLCTVPDMSFSSSSNIFCQIAMVLLRWDKNLWNEDVYPILMFLFFRQKGSRLRVCCAIWPGYLSISCL